MDRMHRLGLGGKHVTTNSKLLCRKLSLCLMLIVSVSVGAMLGCVSPFMAHPECMVPRDLPQQRCIGESACIAISDGGAVSAKRWETSVNVDYRVPVASEVFTIESFAKATDMTLVQKGLFKKIVSCGQHPDAQLDICIMHVGFEWPATVLQKGSAAVAVRWKLFREDANEAVWEDQIVTSGSTWPPGTSTLRALVERLCRENIQQALLQMAQSAPAPVTE